MLLVVWKDISNRVNNFLTTPPLGVAPESIRGRMSNTEEKDASSESKAVSDNGSCRPLLRERMETGGYFTTDLFVRWHTELLAIEFPRSRRDNRDSGHGAADAQAETEPPHGLRERATKVFVARARQWLHPPGGEWSSPRRHSGKSLRQLDREWKYDEG